MRTGSPASRRSGRSACASSSRTSRECARCTFPGRRSSTSGLVARALADDVVAAGGELLLGYEVTGIAERDGPRACASRPLPARWRPATSSSVPACTRTGWRGSAAGPSTRGSCRSAATTTSSGPSAATSPTRSCTRCRTRASRSSASTRRCGRTASMWLGPNAVLAFAREGYGRFELRPGDLRRDACGRPGSGGSPGVTGAWGSARSCATTASGCSWRPPASCCPSSSPTTSSPAPRASAPRRSPATAASSTTSCSSAAPASCTCATPPRRGRPRR